MLADYADGARLGHLDMVRDLLDAAGADREAAGKVYGKAATALFTAVAGNQIKVCRLLLGRGAKHVIYHQGAYRTPPSWQETQGNNVLTQALSQNDSSPVHAFRAICELLWHAVEDKRGINTSYLTAADLSKIPRRKIKK